MQDTLYVANLAPEVTEETLRELFQQYGEVVAVTFQAGGRYDPRYALVKMASEKTATQAMHGLNGVVVAGRYLAVSHPEPDPGREMMPRQRRAAAAIADRLGETEEKPRRMIEAIVRLCGVSFAEAILRETEEVEARGGMQAIAEERRRTKGGVFFYLARHRMSRANRSIVYNRKGRMPSPGTDEPEG